MELRKLNPLRKSVGDAIGEKAFVERYKTRPTPGGGPKRDRNAERIAAAVEPDILAGKIKMPRGGYVLRRGRGRVIVEPTEK